MWLSLSNEHGTITAWPDGKPYLDQPVQLTQALDRIGVEIHRWRKGKPQ